jgi:hypothetical protein
VIAASMSDSTIQYRSKVDQTARRIDFLPWPESAAVSNQHGARVMYNEAFQVPNYSEDFLQAEYQFNFVDRNHLELRSLTETGTSTVVRLRRDDLSTYPLVAHAHAWTW